MKKTDKVIKDQYWRLEWRRPGSEYPWRWTVSNVPVQYCLKDARNMLKRVRGVTQFDAGSGLVYRIVHVKTTEKPIYD